MGQTRRPRRPTATGPRPWPLLLRGALVILLLGAAAMCQAFLLPPSSPTTPQRSQEQRQCQQQRRQQLPFSVEGDGAGVVLRSTVVEPPPPVPISIRREYETWRWRGYKINYRVEGPKGGPPLLLIHGFGASVNHFRNQFEMLPPLGGCVRHVHLVFGVHPVGREGCGHQHTCSPPPPPKYTGYRVFAVDLLGFGASDKEKFEVEYELELWRDLLVDFMEEVEVGLAKNRNREAGLARSLAVTTTDIPNKHTRPTGEGGRAWRLDGNGQLDRRAAHFDDGRGTGAGACERWAGSGSL